MSAESERLSEDLLASIFRVATALVRSERASLMLRDDATADFVIAQAVGLADDVRREARVRLGEGIAGKVAAERRARLERGEASPAGGRYRTGSYLSVPIVVDDVTRGVLNVADPLERGEFSAEDLETLEVVARHIGAVLVQQDQGESLKLLAETDSVTWLFNRRHFDRRLEAEAGRAARSENLLALLMIDVDGFKSINDRFGHRAGDVVLRAVGTAMREAVRVYDVPTRYGGDEFAVILPETDSEAATRVAQRILERLAQAELPEEMKAASERVSVSIGVATYPRPASTAAALIETADVAMYRAKDGGGGAIRVWEHSFAEGPRGSLRSRKPLEHVPYLADPSGLATPELQAHLPAALLQEWNAVVVGKDGQVLTVALPQPNPAAVDALSRASGLAVFPVYSGAADLESARRRLGVGAG